MNVIEVKNLYKIFGSGARERALPMVLKGLPKAEVLKKTDCTVGINDASFEVRKREFFVIMGLSGSGKSTVIRCINQLIQPTSGSVKLDGEELVGIAPERLREIRRKKLGMVFQRFGLLPHRSVIDNVAFGLEVQGIPEAERCRKARQAIELVGLDGYETAMTQALSGGMQQRVGLARALANDPEVLLMDEAFSALDPLIRVQLQDELLELQAREHRTIVFITHDLDEALKLGDRIAIMKDGAIVQIGSPEEILTHPTDDYVRAFVENVDRSKVITAQSVMARTEATIYDRSGPHQTARRLRQLGVSTAYVLDSGRRYVGYVTIDDVLELEKKTSPPEEGGEERSIQGIIRTDKSTATLTTPLADLMAEASKTAIPYPIVDDQGVFKGIVTRPAILAGVAGD